MKHLIISCVCISLFRISNAQPISPNGFSGLGLVPTANTLEKGMATVSFDNAVPGKLINNGYNTQVGFGLKQDLELVGRLATNNQKCNLFITSECPAGSYRDFSTSLKWTLPINQLKQNQAALALGATDFGGAATYFRSYYVVGTKKINQFDMTAGWAKAQVETSMLDGALASVSWRPTQWSQFELQKVGQNKSAHAHLQVPITETGAHAWLTLNHRISENPITPKNWLGWGVSMPLDTLREKKYKAQSEIEQGKILHKKLRKSSPNTLVADLRTKGFFAVKLGSRQDGVLVVELENTAYLWNILDAAGVALGVISAAYANESNTQMFELILTTRGIAQLKVIAEAKCVGRWLETGEACDKLRVQSMSQRLADERSTSVSDDSNFTEQQINWSENNKWNFRPEIVLSPLVISAIGTEYGSLDLDVGVNINAILPLWTGATIETNRLEPTGIGTRQFENGGVFYSERIKPASNRKMIHQLINIPTLNSQARLSAGTAYTVWEGYQLETSSQSDNGIHKLGYTTGSFKNEALKSNNERKYELVNYRFANNDQQTSMTELTQGKFWAGDKGFSINQRFWFGDTTLNIYFRRTRMTENQPKVSFAGIQFAIPFTPRENKSLEYLSVRGVSQWTYSLETKILERENIITGGYGEVPRVGDSLVTTFNRDRNSSRYYDTNLNRIKNAYVNLGND